MSKETGGPAFPIVGQWGVSEQGMTLRDYFAAKAMAAIRVAAPNTDYEQIAISAYVIADEMLKAREQ
jgi:hypothetical protein